MLDLGKVTGSLRETSFLLAIPGVRNTQLWVAVVFYVGRTQFECRLGY